MATAVLIPTTATGIEEWAGLAAPCIAEPCSVAEFTSSCSPQQHGAVLKKRAYFPATAIAVVIPLTPGGFSSLSWSSRQLLTSLGPRMSLFWEMRAGSEIRCGDAWLLCHFRSRSARMSRCHSCWPMKVSTHRASPSAEARRRVVAGRDVGCALRRARTAVSADADPEAGVTVMPLAAHRSRPAPGSGTDEQRGAFWTHGPLNRQRVERWSRREESNAPSAEYNSAALPLSYTGLRIACALYHILRTARRREITRSGSVSSRPRCSLSAMHIRPAAVSGT